MGGKVTGRNICKVKYQLYIYMFNIKYNTTTCVHLCIPIYTPIYTYRVINPVISLKG